MTSAEKGRSSSTHAQSLAAWREELLQRGWFTSADLAKNHSRSLNPAQWARDRRGAGELLGVWSPTEQTYRHPSFQFVSKCDISPRVRELLSALALKPEFTAANDKSGWLRAYWLYGAALNLPDKEGQPRVPADVFVDDPDAVIALARKEAEVDLRGAW